MASNRDRPSTEPACVNNHMLHHFDSPTGGIATGVNGREFTLSAVHARSRMKTLRLGAPAGARRVVAVLQVLHQEAWPEFAGPTQQLPQAPDAQRRDGWRGSASVMRLSIPLLDLMRGCRQ